MSRSIPAGLLALATTVCVLVFGSLPRGYAQVSLTPTPTATTAPTVTPVATATVGPTSTATLIPATIAVDTVVPTIAPSPTVATPTAISSPTATSTLVAPTATPTATAIPPTATATPVTPTATATVLPTATPSPTATKTPLPTPKPNPPRTPIGSPPPPQRPQFQYVSLWFHTVKQGTFDHLEVQTKAHATYGIWVHVYFPSGRPYAFYTKTNSAGHFVKQFRIPQHVVTRFSNTGVITIQLWQNKATAKDFEVFTLL